jgi:DNA modification methylase
VLRDDGTLWLNLGDAYWGSGKAGRNPAYQQKHREFGRPSKRQSAFGIPTNHRHDSLKAKDLIGLPWMVAFQLRDCGWYLRQDIIWHKPNPMPESATDRCVKAHEYLFLLSKNRRYHFDYLQIRQPAKTKEKRPFGVVRDRILDYNSKQRALRPNHRRGMGQPVSQPATMANKRSVWQVATKCYRGAHFATFPEELIRDCILAGCPENGVVLDPFMGAGTTAVTARKLNRQFIGFELNPEYVELANQRLNQL